MSSLLREYIKELQETSVPAGHSGGDCYEAAGRYMMDECDVKGGCEGLVLVHGEVGGQGALDGVRFGHAWVEKGGTVIDKSNGRNITMPKVMYYAIGQVQNIDPEKWGKPEFGHDVFTDGNLHKYTWEEARAKILETGVWGPWDLVTSSGL